MALWLLCILINNPNHNKILPFPFPPHVLSSSPTCRTSTHISGTDQTCPFPPPVLFGKNHEEVPALISWSSYMLADPRLQKESMFLVVWFDPFNYQFHRHYDFRRHHALPRHHDHHRHHHKNNVHNVHGQLDHQTISIDWNQVFSAMPLRRNKQTTDQRLGPAFCLCLCVCSKGTSKQIEVHSHSREAKNN